MSDSIIVQPVVNQVTVTEEVNEVIVSSVGVQGATGATGAKGDKGDTGATGAQGSSGVVSVTAPITNSGTSSAAVIGVNAGSTSAAGVLQLTDSVASTSTTTAATPNAVKTAYDLTVAKTFQVIKTTGLYYTSGMPNRLSDTTIVHQTTYYLPIVIQNAVTADRIACRGGTGLSGGSVRLGIYNDSSGLPSTVLIDAGTVATGAGGVAQITISQSLSVGIYWLAFCQQGTAPTTPVYSGSGGSTTGTFNSVINGWTTPNVAGVMAYSQASVTGAFATATGIATATTSPSIWIRTA